MKVTACRVLLALALSSALLAVASAAGSRKMLGVQSTESTTKTESKDSAKHFGGGWGGSFGGNWGHPAYPHYDYHPAEYVPHGDHYHYVPSHYDFDAFGKRKLLSSDHHHHSAATKAVKPAESTPVASSAQSVKKTESAEKLESAQHEGHGWGGGWGGYGGGHYEHHHEGYEHHDGGNDWDDFGKRKLMSSESTEVVKKAKAVKATEGKKSNKKTEKAEQWGTHHGYQFTDDPYQYTHNPYGYHTPGTIPAYGGFGGIGMWGRKLMTTASTAAAKDVVAPGTGAAAAPVTKKTESAKKTESKDQYGTDHGYQFTDDPYQYTSRYVDHPAEYVQHGDHVHYVPEHQDWYDANSAQHTPGTIPLGRKLQAAESDIHRRSSHHSHNTRSAHGTGRRPLAVETDDAAKNPAQQAFDWLKAHNPAKKPSTVKPSTARKPLAVEVSDVAKKPTKSHGPAKKAGTKESAKQWGEYMAYHPAEYVPHGDHVHYVPDHRDAVYGTQVAPGVIIPGAPGSVMPAFGKRKLLAIGSTKAQTTKATEPVKTTTAVKANQKIEKAQQWGGQQYEHHPAEYVQHGDHYHYVPEHYDAAGPAYNNPGYDNTGALGQQMGGMIGGIIGAALG